MVLRSLRVDFGRYMHITQMDSGTGLRAGLQIFPIGVDAQRISSK